MVGLAVDAVAPRSLPLALVPGLSFLRFSAFGFTVHLFLCVGELEGTAAEYVVVDLRGVGYRVLASRDGRLFSFVFD